MLQAWLHRPPWWPGWHHRKPTQDLSYRPSGGWHVPHWCTWNKDCILSPMSKSFWVFSHEYGICASAVLTTAIYSILWLIIIQSSTGWGIERPRLKLTKGKHNERDQEKIMHNVIRRIERPRLKLTKRKYNEQRPRKTKAFCFGTITSYSPQ